LFGVQREAAHIHGDIPAEVQELQYKLFKLLYCGFLCYDIDGDRLIDDVPQINKHIHCELDRTRR